MLLSDLGLAQQSLRMHLANRTKFLANKDRLERLRKLVSPNDNALDIDRKIIAVLARGDAVVPGGAQVGADQVGRGEQAAGEVGAGEVRLRQVVVAEVRLAGHRAEDLEARQAEAEEAAVVQGGVVK